MTTAYCCDKHAADHEKDLHRQIEDAGMRLIPVHPAIGHGAGAEYVLLYPDGTGSLHPGIETAVGEAGQIAQMMATSSAGKLKRNIAAMLDEYGIRQHRRPLEKALCIAVDAYAASRKAGGGSKPA